MLRIADEVVTGALVDAIAAVGRQISKTMARSQRADDLTTAHLFETLRMTGTLPDQPGLSPASRDPLAGILHHYEVQGALQELLAAQLTDASETGASRAREGAGMAVTAADPDAAGFAAWDLASYSGSQICPLVACLEAQDPPLLTQICSEALSARVITILRAIERHTAALADEERWPASGTQIELLEVGA
jgi:hypothetical protein